jgi:hypothetical protein
MESRQTFSWRLCQSVVRGVMLLVLSLAALGCQREPEPPELLGFDPPSPAAHAGASIYIPDIPHAPIAFYEYLTS